jgi:hypothetical protein
MSAIAPAYWVLRSGDNLGSGIDVANAYADVVVPLNTPSNGLKVLVCRLQSPC